MTTYDRTKPRLVTDATYPTPLPVVEVVTLGPFLCPSCLGYRFDVWSEDSSKTMRPCPTCDNEGWLPIGSTMHLDCAARWWWQDDRPHLGILNVGVLARLRSPWRGRDGWHQMARTCEMRPVWGPRSLECLMLEAAQRACGGMQGENTLSSGLPGVMIREVRAASPVVWPSGWPKPPRRVCSGGGSGFGAEVRALLDLRPEEIERW